MSLNLRPGDVIWWENFPLNKFKGEIKPRWLIVLGRTATTDIEEIWFFCTTTTRYREELIKKKDGMPFSPPPFADDCYLYFDEEIMDISRATLDANETNISPKGNIDPELFKQIYLGYFVTQTQSPKILKYIKNSASQFELPILLP